VLELDLGVGWGWTSRGDGDRPHAPEGSSVNMVSHAEGCWSRVLGSRVQDPGSRVQGSGFRSRVLTSNRAR
jgi:hypothetical protein